MGTWASPSGASEFDESLLKDVKTSRDFKLAHPELVKRVKECFDAYIRTFPHRQIIATCTYRSPAEQNRLYLQGRFGNPGKIVTMIDGIIKKSQHNYFPARAVDVAILDGGKCIWDDAVFWPLGNLARECKISWGGFWEKWQDPPHLELPKEVV